MTNFQAHLPRNLRLSDSSKHACSRICHSSGRLQRVLRLYGSREALPPLREALIFICQAQRCKIFGFYQFQAAMSTFASTDFSTSSISSLLEDSSSLLEEDSSKDSISSLDELCSTGSSEALAEEESSQPAKKRKRKSRNPDNKLTSNALPHILHNSPVLLDYTGKLQKEERFQEKVG